MARARGWRRHLAALLALGLVLAGAAEGRATPCATAAQCGAEETCHRPAGCAGGVCVPAFTLPQFVIGVPSLTAYDADVVSALDHTGTFYQGCCDTNITAFTGESADRADGHVFCPEEPTNFPACLFASCLCGYLHPDGEPFVVNGAYASPFGPQFLYYAGHAGYDYDYGFGVELVAAEGGMLCKAVEDPINGRFGFATAWEKFHTFYIDHGVFAGRGHASWYLHAADLTGEDTGGAPLDELEPGECAPVVRGQVVATVGNQGTGLPHLHFEVRRYVPADGPEAFSTRVVDPYGWKGAGPDPWSDPSENAQAESQTAPLWIACGNGRVECGETCDDGDRLDGDGCDGSCAVEDGFVCEGDEPTECFRDHPIAARRIALVRAPSGRERLVFSSRDEGLPFPAIGSPDDPTIAGMEIEILSATGERATFTVPPGEGAPPGWRTTAGTSPAYRYRNRGAPGGPSAVRALRQRDGRGLNLSAKAVGVALADGEGAIAVRLRSGALRSCALFAPGRALILRDEAGRFQAKNASAAGLADCSLASLGMPSP